MNTIGMQMVSDNIEIVERDGGILESQERDTMGNNTTNQ